MSGHSKWSTIKRQKGVADAKKGKLFTKLAQAITIAARDGGDPTSNSRLRLAMDKAREASMPKDNIERAISKAAGGGEGGQLEEVTYEAYGPGGVALVINCITDNRNRTSSEVKHILTRHNGRLAESNSVRWQFSSQGVLQFPASIGNSREELELSLIEIGIQDLVEAMNQLIIYTAPNDLERVKKFLEDKGVVVSYSGVELVAQNPLSISDEAVQKQLDQLKDALDELDDVESIFTNEG